MFHLEMNGVSAIVFNGGESFAVKRMPSYMDERFVTRDNPSVPFDVAKHLEKDLTFFSEGDKAGNPGELYSPIEFSVGRKVVVETFIVI